MAVIAMSIAQKRTAACHRHDLARGGLQANAIRRIDEINKQDTHIADGSASALIHQCDASNVDERIEPIRFNKLNIPIKAAMPRTTFGMNGFW